MTEHPILFSDPLVRAILAGTKTQTRRVVRGGLPAAVTAALDAHSGDLAWAWGAGGYGGALALGGALRIPLPQRCPYGAPGDLLYVREAWAKTPNEDGMLYRATEPNVVAFRDLLDGRWRPSIHMPRWASRLTLRVTDVRIERLQAITDEDARAEGVTRPPDWFGPERVLFQRLWREINDGRDGCGWDADPWVWVVSFERVTS